MENKLNLDDHEYQFEYTGTIDGVAPNTLTIGYGRPEIKSHLKIGNMVISNTHRFNWFQRKMWKLFFGFEIENVENK
jgi:hypothetical protein